MARFSKDQLSVCFDSVMTDSFTAESIFALSSGGGKAGIAVFRLSGPATAGAITALTGIVDPEPRRVLRVKITDPAVGEEIDDGLLIWFPSPASFTGEDVAELHLHGSPAVIATVTEILSALDGFRAAEPGEFTRRAFDNGKLDLTQSEGLADLINAETSAQRRQARRQMSGELAELYEGWRDRLVHAAALFEAEIDFSDEDLPPGLREKVDEEIAAIVSEIEDHLDDNRRGQAIRDGVQVAIIGPPNAGKSSLLNWLARRDVAIVSETAGTTRDIIEVHLDLAGFPVTLADTAGIRVSDDAIEAEGVRRAEDRAELADFKVVVFDGATWPEVDGATTKLIDPAADIVLVNKLDLEWRLEDGVGRLPCPATPVSVQTGENLAHILGAIEDRIKEAYTPASAPFLTRQRHRDALAGCLESLRRFQEAPATELAAEDLRLAVRALGRITGRVDVEDILDVIFKEFCIGK
jgi:tRNA modification GTPase